MSANKIEKRWLPYLVAAVGILSSSILSYLFWLDSQSDLTLISILDDYIPGFLLIMGILISLLISSIMRMRQLTRLRMMTLTQVREELKNEINERIQAEETKQKLEVALLQGQKLQAIGTLAGGIAHDFNNLLYAISGYADMAREDVPKDSLIHANLGKVLEASQRGKDLVARILAFSRRQPHHFERIQLKSAIETALALLRPTIPASVSIEFEAETEMVIHGNQTQIHQVFVNIINNAVDAMDGEGTISIRMAPHYKGNTQQNPYCKIDISDSGHGMDQSTVERIFEPFYTTKEVGKGTGLGLSIAHSIVNDHEGEISAKSQLGHGTTFTILLPELSQSE